MYVQVILSYELPHLFKRYSPDSLPGGRGSLELSPKTKTVAYKEVMVGSDKQKAPRSLPNASRPASMMLSSSDNALSHRRASEPRPGCCYLKHQVLMFLGE